MKLLKRTPVINSESAGCRRGARLLFCLLVLLLGVGACGQQGDAWQRVQERGVLRVGIDPTYPPFAAADDTAVYGFDIDLAQALAEQMGVTAEFVLFGYDGLYDALATQQVDLLLSALVVSPERTRDFAYSTPYFNAGEVLLLPLGDDGVTSMADLNGRRLAVELGALGHVEALAWEKRVAGLTILPYPSADEALTAVVEGAADAALVDAISGRLFLQATPTLQLLPNSVTVEPFAAVVRIDDGRLLSELNRALAYLEKNGELEQMIQQWLGP